MTFSGANTRSYLRNWRIWAPHALKAFAGALGIAEVCLAPATGYFRALAIATASVGLAASFTDCIAPCFMQGGNALVALQLLCVVYHVLEIAQSAICLVLFCQ